MSNSKQVLLDNIASLIDYRVQSLTNTVNKLREVQEDHRREELSMRELKVMESIGAKIASIIRDEVSVKLQDVLAPELNELRIIAGVPTSGGGGTGPATIVGLIEAFDEDPGSDWVPADGREMDQVADSNLYEVLGDDYNLSKTSPGHPWSNQSVFNRENNKEVISTVTKTMFGELVAYSTNTIEMDGCLWSITPIGDGDGYGYDGAELLVYSADIHDDHIDGWREGNVFIPISIPHENGYLVKLNETTMAYIYRSYYIVLEAIDGNLTEVKQVAGNTSHDLFTGTNRSSITKEVDGVTYVVLFHNSAFQVLKYEGGSLTVHQIDGRSEHGTQHLDVGITSNRNLTISSDYIYFYGHSTNVNTSGRVALDDFIRGSFTAEFFTDDSPLYNNFINRGGTASELYCFTVDQTDYLISSRSRWTNDESFAGNLLKVSGTPGSPTLELIMSNLNGVGDPIPTNNSYVRLGDDLAFPYLGGYTEKELANDMTVILKIDNGEVVSSRNNTSFHPEMVRHPKIQNLESEGLNGVGSYSETGLSFVLGDRLYYFLYNRSGGYMSPVTAIIVSCGLDQEGVVIDNTHQIEFTEIIPYYSHITSVVIYNDFLYMSVLPDDPDEDSGIGNIYRYSITNDFIDPSSKSITKIHSVGSLTVHQFRITANGRFLYVHGAMAADISTYEFIHPIVIYEIMGNGDLAYSGFQKLNNSTYSGLYFHRGKAYVGCLVEMDPMVGNLEPNNEGNILEIYDIEDDGTLTRSGEVKLPDDPSLGVPLTIGGLVLEDGIYITSPFDLTKDIGDLYLYYCKYDEEEGIINSFEMLKDVSGRITSSLADTSDSMLDNDTSSHFSITKSMLYYTGNREITGIPFKGGFNDYSFITDGEAKTGEGKFNLPNIPGSYVKVK